MLAQKIRPQYKLLIIFFTLAVLTAILFKICHSIIILTSDLKWLGPSFLLSLNTTGWSLAFTYWKRPVDADERGLGALMFTLTIAPIAVLCISPTYDQFGDLISVSYDRTFLYGSSILQGIGFYCIQRTQDEFIKNDESIETDS